MGKEQYLEKRNALIAEAEAFLSNKKVDEAKAKRAEVEALDAEFEKNCKDIANAAALQEKNILDLTKKSAVVEGGTPAAQTEGGKVMDEKEKNVLAYENAFSKYMMNLDLSAEEQGVFDKVNADFMNTTQTAASHSVLIPDTVKAGIWQEIGEAHPILKALNMTFIPGDVTIDKETVSGEDGDWYDEATEVAEGTLGFGTVNLTGCELAKDITVSWKLKKMSVPEFIAYITSKLAEKMGNALAKAVVNGLGKPGEGDTHKPQPKGIVTALNAEGSTPQVVTYTTSIAYTDLTALFAKIKSGYLADAQVYAKNAVIWGQLANIVAPNGVSMFVPDITGGGVARLFGRPVFEEDAVPDNAILVANVAKGYAMNVNENVSMSFEDHVKLRKTDYMSYALIDGDVLTTKAFALLKKS